MLNNSLTNQVWARGSRFLVYLNAGLYSSFSNPWPRPGLAVLFIESLEVVHRRTVLKRMLRRTRAGLNCAAVNFERE